MTETEARRLLELGREAVLTGPQATEWLERLRPERENLRGAIEWLAANGELDAATDLAVSVWAPVAPRRSDPGWASLYLESLALNRKLGEMYMCCVELHNLGHVSLHRGNLEAAAAYFSECAELRKGSSDPYDAAMESLNAAAMAFHKRDADRATSLLAETESTLDEVGIVLDPDDQFEVDWLHEHLAQQP